MTTDVQTSPQDVNPTPPEDREWTTVRWEVTSAGVLAITLDRERQHNAINFPMVRELQQLMREVAPRPAVRVVTIEGAGTRAFSSGDDLKGMAGEPGVDNAISGHHQLEMLMRELPKPVVGLLKGWALGAGFELALACDFRLAADNIEIGDHRATRAIAPIAGSTWFLPRIVGHTRALELLMTGRHLDAEESLAWGMVNRVWPLEEFDERAAEYVAMLASLPTVTTGVFKAAMEYSATHGLRESMAHEIGLGPINRASEDAAEGRRSFLERRDPEFRGR